MVLDDGTLYTFGYGSFGQLGHGDTEDQVSPKRVEVEAWKGRKVTSVACGANHTAVVLDHGTLYTFGDGGNGRLGHGNTVIQVSPTLVNMPVPETPRTLMERMPKLMSTQKNKITSVACGANHTAVVYNEKLYTFGRNNDEGQLGFESGWNLQKITNRKHEPTRYKTWRKSVYGPKEVQHPNLQEVQSVACGSGHTSVLLKNGELYFYGDYRYIPESERVKRVLDDTRVLYTDPEDKAYVEETKIAYYPVPTSRDPREGRNGDELWKGITSVACGNRHTAFIHDGKLYTFGHDGRNVGVLGYALQTGSACQEIPRRVDFGN